MPEDHVEGLVQVEVPGVPEQRLHAVVVALREEPGGPRRDAERGEPRGRREAGEVHDPAAERLRRGDDVGLRVARVAAHREQLHALPAEVLVRVADRVRDPVEEDEHRRVLGDGVEQVGEALRRVLADRHLLLAHQVRDTDLPEARREVVLPEPHEALLDQPGRRGHLVDPPADERDDVGGPRVLARRRCRQRRRDGARPAELERPNGRVVGVREAAEQVGVRAHRQAPHDVGDALAVRDTHGAHDRPPL
ncbi:MAG TPA: hypothetical protein VGU73_00805 [Acidimicrobiia bacterium]|nr:hypothetical protein [Acidimicrobiia bacterium]